MSIYFLWYDGKLENVGMYDGDTSDEDYMWLLENLNPFKQVGYKEGLSLYKDGTKWAIHSIRGEFVDEDSLKACKGPGMSFEEMIPTPNLELDILDGTVLDGEAFYIKNRIRRGYPLSEGELDKIGNYSLKITILQWCIQYNRRRLFKSIFPQHCRYLPSPYITDIALTRYVLQHGDSSSTDSDSGDPKILYLLIYLEVRDMVFSQPFLFFSYYYPNPCALYNPPLLSGLYDGLSAALRAL